MSLVDLAAVILLAGAILPVSRLPRDARFRRLFPAAAAAVAAAMLSWWLLVFALVVAVPAWLVPAAAVTSVAWACGYWRARPEYGRARGLPPGSLSLIESIAGIAERGFCARNAAVHGPVFKTSQVTCNVVCVVGLERAQRLLREHADAIVATPLPFHHQIPGGFLRYMDDATHDRYGGVFRRAFGGSLLDATTPSIRGIVRRELNRLAEQVSTDREGLDPKPALERITHDALVAVLFGAQPGSDRYRAFEARWRGLDSVTIQRRWNRRERLALDEIIEATLADARAAESPVDANPSVITRMHQFDPELPDEVAVANLVLTQAIGQDNLAGLLDWLLVMLADNPEWKQRLRERPEDAEAFVAETLRLARSEYLYRTLGREVRFEGYRLPRGWRLRICVAESHRDPEVFEQADRFTDRFVNGRYRQSEYSPFGMGRHACTGAGLATLVSRVFLEELTSGFDFDLSGFASPVRGFRHWSHWNPGPAPRLRVVATGPAAPGGCPFGAAQGSRFAGKPGSEVAVDE